MYLDRRSIFIMPIIKEKFDNANQKLKGAMEIYRLDSKNIKKWEKSLHLRYILMSLKKSNPSKKNLKVKYNRYFFQKM